MWYFWEWVEKLQAALKLSALKGLVKKFKDSHKTHLYNNNLNAETAVPAEVLFFDYDMDNKVL